MKIASRGCNSAALRILHTMIGRTYIPAFHFINRRSSLLLLLLLLLLLSLSCFCIFCPVGEFQEGLELNVLNHALVNIDDFNLLVSDTNIINNIS